MMAGCLGAMMGGSIRTTAEEGVRETRRTIRKAHASRFCDYSYQSNPEDVKPRDGVFVPHIYTDDNITLPITMLLAPPTLVKHHSHRPPIHPGMHHLPHHRGVAFDSEIKNSSVLI